MIRGGNSIADGPIDDANCRAAMEAVNARGFGHEEEEDARCITFCLDFVACSFFFCN